ncbi:MAG: antibiotic biosynthesis monooxygenase [Crocinitomicaceae bacterium]
MIANTPKPPYYAVIFTSTLKDNHEGYSETADKIASLAKDQDGYLGIESARNEIGITVSYWKDLKSIKQWKANTEHQSAQRKGNTIWYEKYQVRIAKVERDYSLGFED